MNTQLACGDCSCATRRTCTQIPSAAGKGYVQTAETKRLVVQFLHGSGGCSDKGSSVEPGGRDFVEGCKDTVQAIVETQPAAAAQKERPVRETQSRYRARPAIDPTKAQSNPSCRLLLFLFSPNTHAFCLLSSYVCVCVCVCHICHTPFDTSTDRRAFSLWKQNAQKV